MLVLDTACVYGAYLLYGSPERLDGTLAVTDLSAHFTRPTSPSFCQGKPDLSPGDIDGDGRADLVLAAPPHSDNEGDFVLGQDEGLYVFYGRAERFSGDIPFAAADARLNASIVLDQVMSGDMNGDGLSDLLAGSGYAHESIPHGVVCVPGRADRWSELVDLEARAIALDGAVMPRSPNMPKFGDVDGDGLSDVLLLDDKELLESPNTAAVHLFYGAPGLFADGIDFRRANAQLFAMNSATLSTAGDRDGDGDDELVDAFTQLDTNFANVAFVAGSRQRLSGALTVSEAEVAAQDDTSLQLDMFQAPVAADLDGDGASDIITVTTLYDEDDQPTARLNFTTIPSRRRPRCRSFADTERRHEGRRVRAALTRPTARPGRALDDSG